MTTETRPRSLTIELPEHFIIRRRKVQALPSANVVTRWNFGGQRFWFVELKKLYALHILKAEADAGARWGAPADRVEIEIVRRCARLFDGDNVYVKALLDVMKGRLVVDDSPAHVALVARQEKTKPAARGVIVRVQEVSGNGG